MIEISKRGYEENIRAKNHNVMNIIFNNIPIDNESADNGINPISEELNNVIHNAAVNAIFNRSSKYQGRHRQVLWWTSQYTVGQNSMRFWRNIWCGSTTVRHGPESEIYKSTKKMYRNIRR